MISSTVRSVGLALALVLPTAAKASAQVEIVGDTVCVNAGRSLEARVPDRSVSRALSDLVTCAETGPSAIGKFWVTAPREREVLASLAEVSGRLRDRRLHEVVRSILLDRAADENLRVAALGAVATHGDPCFALYIRPVPTDAPGGSAYAMPGWRNDDLSRQGSEALPESIRQDVIELLDSLATAEPETPVGKVALLAVRELRRGGVARRC